MQQIKKSNTESYMKPIQPIDIYLAKMILANPQLQIYNHKLHQAAILSESAYDHIEALCRLQQEYDADPGHAHTYYFELVARKYAYLKIREDHLLRIYCQAIRANINP